MRYNYVTNLFLAGGRRKNASIEAARAGETGKGFAVVAEGISDAMGENNRVTEQLNNSTKRFENL